VGGGGGEKVRQGRGTGRLVWGEDKRRVGEKREIARPGRRGLFERCCDLEKKNAY
jgi:hypothetical protein